MCLDLPVVSDAGAEQDRWFKRNYGIIKSRLECAQTLIQVKSMAKRSPLFKPDNEGTTCYDLVLNVFAYSTREMKKKRDEIKDRDTIQRAEEVFQLSNIIAEDIQDNYPQAQRRRNKFALRMFATEAFHYVLFLLCLTIAAFLGSNENDQSTYYFGKVIKGE